MDASNNIILIGMPGVGKSTVGVLLAKETGRGFVDTDVWIQTRERRPLQELLDTRGLVEFCRLEERHVASLSVRSHVIATGGSVVYSSAAMGRLGDTGPIVYLRLSLETLRRRITNMSTRGVVISEGQTLDALYEERRELYETWADVTVDCEGKTQDCIVAEIVEKLRPNGK